MTTFYLRAELTWCKNIPTFFGLCIYEHWDMNTVKANEVKQRTI